MLLCSRQIGSNVVASDLVSALKSVGDLRALVLPLAANQHLEVPFEGNQGLGVRGRWLAQAMPLVRTLLYIDPQLSISAALGAEPWREAIEGVCQSLVEADLGTMLVGRVVGDDLVERMDSLLAAGCEFVNTETGLPLEGLGRPLQSMRAALGAAPFVHAATEGCRVVLGGASSLGAMSIGFLHSDQTIDRQDWDGLAQMTLHAMVAEQASLAIELTEDGRTGLRRAPWTPGDTQLESCVRQSLERLAVVSGASKIGLPDVSIVDLGVEIQVGAFGEITLAGVRGGPPSPDLPVEMIYRAGHKSTLMASAIGPQAGDELEQVAHLLESRFPLTQRSDGREGIVAYLHDRVDQDPPARRLSIDIFGRTESSVAETYGVAREMLAKVSGCTFHTAELPKVVIDYLRWPTTIPRELMEWDVEIRAASDWA